MAHLSGYEVQLKTPFASAISGQANKPADNQFDLITGLRTSGLNFSSSPIDVTTASSEENREILDGHGITMLDVSGSGGFKRLKTSSGFRGGLSI